VSAARLAGWRASFGADRFALPLGEWSLIGVNAQLLGTGLPEEAEAWAWLEEVVQEADGRPVALFTHKPLFWRGPADGDDGNHWPSACRERLRGMLGRGRLRLAVSGHLH
jgi:hypothetical protein